MNIDNEKYTQHKVFTEIGKYADFYDSLSFSTMHFIAMGTTALNFDTYIFLSIKGTLKSISVLLSQGRINDSYALLRKYYDSCIINAYEIAYLQEHFSIDNFIVEKINNWLKGKEKLPEYRVMKQFLEKNPKLTSINKLLEKDDRYKLIRSRCNDHMHYNLFQHMMINNDEVYIEDRSRYLDTLSTDLLDIFTLHFAYLFTLNSHYMSSSDYFDAIDMGMTPEEGSQYFVAPFIQEIFDSVVKIHRVDIALLLKADSGMNLE